MADVVETTPENQDTVVTKSVEGKVSDDSNSKVTEETPVVENGVHNGDSPESTTAEAEVNNVAENESTEVKQENGITENGEMAKVEESEAPAEGSTEEPTEATTVQAEGNAEAVVEEPKEEAPPKVKLHQFPPGKEIPSLSPFCLKLETFLRINKIPYQNDYGYKMGKKGKLPWIEYKGEKKNDSNMIMDYLNQTFEVNLDKDLSNEQLALGRAVKSMLEENTYWALVYNRYVDQFQDFKKLVPTPSGGSLGFNVSQKMFQRKMQKCLDGQGLGRHSKEELYKIAEDDLKSLSDLLGEKEYLLGENPSSYDCTVFGLCANILYSGMENPMCTYIKENAKNISALCDRMKELYWHDWAEMVLGEKTEPSSLKKGFSFRKKKSKAPKAKETPAEEAPAEEAATTTDETTPEEKPVENGEVPSPSSEVAPTEETSTETPSEEKPAASEEKESAEVPTETTETTSTEVTETEPDKEA